MPRFSNEELLNWLKNHPHRELFKNDQVYRAVERTIQRKLNEGKNLVDAVNEALHTHQADIKKKKIDIENWKKAIQRDLELFIQETYQKDQKAKAVAQEKARGTFIKQASSQQQQRAKQEQQYNQAMSSQLSQNINHIVGYNAEYLAWSNLFAIIFAIPFFTVQLGCEMSFIQADTAEEYLGKFFQALSVAAEKTTDFVIPMVPENPQQAGKSNDEHASNQYAAAANAARPAAPKPASQPN